MAKFHRDFPNDEIEVDSPNSKDEIIKDHDELVVTLLKQVENLTQEIAKFKSVEPKKIIDCDLSNDPTADEGSKFKKLVIIENLVSSNNNNLDETTIEERYKSLVCHMVLPADCDPSLIVKNINELKIYVTHANFYRLRPAEFLADKDSARELYLSSGSMSFMTELINFNTYCTFGSFVDKSFCFHTEVYS